MEIFSGVYQYSFKNSTRKYIGSSINLRRRHDYHMSYLKLNKHNISDFQKDYNLYGIENLKYEILEYFDNFSFLNKLISKKIFQEALFKKEQYHLDKYGAQDYLKDNNTIFFKLLYNKSALAKNVFSIKNNLKIKKIYQYDNKGHYLDSFENSVTAGNYLNLDESSIRRCCQYQRLTVGNYIFSYEKKPKIEPRINKILCPINQYDINKNFIARYYSINEAKRKTGIDIRKEKKQPCLLQGTFYWLFDNEDFPVWKREKNPNKELEKECEMFFDKKIGYGYGERLKFVKNMSKKYNITESSIQNMLQKFIKK
jgi:hypothetical protein